MPRPRRQPAPGIDLLVGAAALATRWTERLLASHEPPLTVGQYLALRSIDREPLTAAELARRTGVSGPAVSQLVAALEDAGWVARTPDADDRRRQGLALTEPGALALGSATALLRERMEPLLADLPRRELDALDGLLEQLESALGGTPPPRRPPPRPRRPEAPPPPAR
jgi:DNA-binding MarR family transcriptional regulator